MIRQNNADVGALDDPGTRLDNPRKRAAKLTEQCRVDLDAAGMGW
jgi:hypothetical protein